MNFLMILYGGIIGVLIGEILDLRSELKKLKKSYDDSFEERLKELDE